MHLQLDELAVQLLLLSQNLVDTKLLMEKFTKEGYIALAQSRYAMGGPSSVSGLATTSYLALFSIGVRGPIQGCRIPW